MSQNCKEVVVYSTKEVASKSAFEDVTIVLCPHPFSAMKQIYTREATKNIIGLLVDIGCKLRTYEERYAICLNGVPIPQKDWVKVFPKPGQTLSVRCIPQGGGGKGPLGFIIAGLALAAAFFIPVTAPYLLTSVAGGGTAFTALGTAIAGVSIGLIAQGIFGLIYPAPSLQLPESSGPVGRVSSLTGIRNRGLPYGTIPRVFGRHRMFPPFGAVPYTEIEGDNQYLVCLFCLGYGPMTISELKIGDTNLSSYEDVEYRFHSEHTGLNYPFTIYTADVFEDNVNVELTNFSSSGDPSSSTVRTTTQDTTKISIDIIYPEGIVYVDKRGRLNSHTLGVNVWYRKTGTSQWLRAGAGPYELTESTRELQRQNISFNVPKGQYDVGVSRSRVSRDTDEDTENREFYSNKILWGVIRSFKDTPPVQTKKNLGFVEMRIRSTDQLNGVLDEFNCVVESHLMTYNGNWISEKTNNPAWAYASVLIDEANARRLSTTRIDANALQAWANWCDTNDFTYNRVLDSRNTVFDQMREIASAGRASFHIVDGQYSVVRDIPQTTPVQWFSPRNTFNYHGEKSFVKDRPHALRIPFINEERGWTDDERVVYDDGYHQDNATLFETIPLPGITDPRQIWRQGRYFIAQARLRPEVHIFGTDIEHLTCSRGDLVVLVQDVINLGIGSARIKEVYTNSSGDVEGVMVDTLFPVKTNENYAVKIRQSQDNPPYRAEISLNVDIPPGTNSETNRLNLETPILSTDPEKPEVGDLLLFGTRASTVGRFVVRAIEHGSDLTATLSVVQEAPTLQQVDIGVIPPWNPQITDQTVNDARRPPVPTIVSIRSDESVLVRDADGSLRVQVVVELSIKTWKHSDELFYQVRYRKKDTEEWKIIAAVSTEANAVNILDVEEGEEYDIAVRSLTIGSKLQSNWSAFQRHRVIGKSEPPPDVPTFFAARDQDGGRLLSWDLPDPPLDLAGYKIRFKQQAATSRILGYQYHQRVSGGTWGDWVDIPDSHIGGPNFTGFDVTGLTTDQTLEFQLRAKLFNNTFSSPSAIVTVTVP